MSIFLKIVTHISVVPINRTYAGYEMGKFLLLCHSARPKEDDRFSCDALRLREQLFLMQVLLYPEVIDAFSFLPRHF